MLCFESVRVYNALYMLRKILIGIGIFIAVLPYLGFPHAWQVVMDTLAGLGIVGLLTLSRRPRQHNFVREFSGEENGILHVERHEVQETPTLHIERDVVTETTSAPMGVEGEATIERQVTVSRKRRRKSEDGVVQEVSSDPE